jgi:hypothetical protein
VELNPRPLNTDFTTDARISLTSWKFPHPRLKNVVDVLGRKKKHVFDNKRADEEHEIGLEVVAEKHEDGERVERSFLPLILLVRF